MNDRCEARKMIAIAVAFGMILVTIAIGFGMMILREFRVEMLP